MRMTPSRRRQYARERLRHPRCETAQQLRAAQARLDYFELAAAQGGHEREPRARHPHALAGLQNNVCFLTFLRQPQCAGHAHDSRARSLVQQEHAVARQIEAGWAKIDFHGTLLRHSMESWIACHCARDHLEEQTTSRNSSHEFWEWLSRRARGLRSTCCAD